MGRLPPDFHLDAHQLRNVNNHFDYNNLSVMKLVLHDNGSLVVIDNEQSGPIGKYKMRNFLRVTSYNKCVTLSCVTPKYYAGCYCLYDKMFVRDVLCHYCIKE